MNIIKFEIIIELPIILGICLAAFQIFSRTTDTSGDFRYKLEKSKIARIYDRFALALGILAIMLAVFISIASTKLDNQEYVYDKKTQSVDIASLQDNSSVSGQFFLGSGQVNGTMAYTYMIHDADGGYTMKTIDAVDAKIYESDDATPHIETWNMKKSFLFLYEDKTVYKIYIPENSIKINYDIDLQ